MDRRGFIAALAASSASTAVAAGEVRGAAREFAELSLADIARAQAQGRLTASALTGYYLERIAAFNAAGPRLGAVLEVNPKAPEAAASLDAERRAQGPRGPLHGVPVLIKDNIETADPTMTTAGSLALEGWYAPRDAPLVARLRAAGAVILGKSNLSEWANFRSTHSVSGWSARGGQARNPYALARSPSGSSSGSAVAVAANLCAVAVGSETDGSIVSPASVNGLVGIKPTLGVVSRRGIVPIAHSQDTAGPIARSVADAAILLTAMSGADPEDPASVAAGDRLGEDYAVRLDGDGLRGARLGVARRFFADNAPLDHFLDGCLAQLRAAGAVLIDPADLPEHGTWSDPEQQVLLYEFKADLEAFLAERPALKIHTLAELIAFNEAMRARELADFDQELLISAAGKGPLSEAAYREARATCLRVTRENGIDAVLAAHSLDAIVTLTSGPAWLIDPIAGDLDTGGCSSPAAIAGYPHVTVPAGFHRGLPIGLSFFGTAFADGKLLRLAAGFEHLAHARVPAPLNRYV